MLVTVVLVLATLVARMAGPRPAGWQTPARHGMAVAMAVAGAAHLAGPEPFIQHLPTWVPAREAIVFSTGVIEIGFGVALLASRARRSAIGRLLALFLIAIWPANVYVAVAGVDVDGQPSGPYPWIRLPFQILFVAWALWSTRDTPGADQAEVGSPVPAITHGKR